MTKMVEPRYWYTFFHRDNMQGVPLKIKKIKSTFGITRNAAILKIFCRVALIEISIYASKFSKISVTHFLRNRSRPFIMGHPVYYTMKLGNYRKVSLLVLFFDNYFWFSENLEKFKSPELCRRRMQLNTS